MISDVDNCILSPVIWAFSSIFCMFTIYLCSSTTVNKEYIYIGKETFMFAGWEVQKAILESSVPYFDKPFKLAVDARDV